MGLPQRPLWGSWYRRLIVPVANGAVVLCVVLAVRAAWIKTEPLEQFGRTGWSDWGRDRFSEVGRLYEGIRPHLGQVERVGLVCGESGDDTGELHHYMAQSILAPVIVSKAKSEFRLIAVFESEAELVHFLEVGDFTVHRRVASGVAILDRVGR